MADFVPAFSAQGVPPARAVPGAAIAMAVTSVFMLSLTTHSILPPAIATVVLCLTPLLASNAVMAPLARWLVRPAVLVAVLVKLLVAGFRFDQDWLLDPLLLAGIGFFLSGEIAFQAARPRDKGKNSVPSLLLLSALIVICASFTRDVRFIPYLTPLYFLFLLMTLYRYSPEERVNAGAARRSVRTQVVLFGALVLATGLLLHCALWLNRDPITRMFMGLMQRFEQRATTGLPEVPYLRSTTEMAQSRKRLFRVIGELNDPHLRLASYDYYSSPGSWRPMIATRWLGTIAGPELNPNLPGPRLRIERITDNTGLMYVPLHAAGVVTDEPVQLEYTRWFDNGPLRAVSLGSGHINYEIIQSANREHQWMFCQPRMDSPEVHKKFDFDPHGSRYEVLTKVPNGVDPRVIALGQSVTQGLQNSRDKIRAVQKYLADNHRYSLKVDLPRGDPISMFLLNKEDGFCEYFASAAVMLLRASGVPSRYVQGYYAHDRRADGSYLVRARDAHAWCESWVEGTGWVNVEATPASGTPDATNQPTLFERFTEWLSELWDDLSSWLMNNGWKGVLYGGLVVLLLVGIYRFRLDWMNRMRGVRGVVFSYASPGAALQDIHTRFEVLLQHRRAACPPDRTWHEHLEWLARENTSAKLDLEKAREFVRGYNAARFRNAVPFDDVKRLDALLTGLERG